MHKHCVFVEIVHHQRPAAHYYQQYVENESTDSFCNFFKKKINENDTN